MSRGINKFIGIGNVCNDVETRYMPNGNAVSNITIACGDEYKDKNTGDMVDKTEFVRIVFFNRLAEIVEQYVKKGSKLYVEGKLQTRSWEQDGVKKYTTEIVANEMQMLDSRVSGSETGNSREQAPAKSQPQHKPAQQQPQGFDDFDQEIPFN